MNLPSHADCLTLLEEYRTPLHVRKHCFVVAKVAVALGEALRKAGHKVDIDALDRAGMLHDMLRVVNFRDFEPDRFIQTISSEDLNIWKEQQRKYVGEHHAVAAKRELEQRGFAELGTIIEAHRVDAIHGVTAQLDTLEKQILYYADKRVAHTDIVSIAERFAEWESRHSWDAEKLQKVETEKELVYELERELFKELKIKPGALSKIVDKSWKTV